MANNYIVRIYRYEINNPYPTQLVGVVENFEADSQQAFSNIDELWEILRAAENSENRRRIREAGGNAGT